jgi:hypothetical protein
MSGVHAGNRPRFFGTRLLVKQAVPCLTEKLWTRVG